MLNRSWQESLQAELRRLHRSDRPVRVALMGIGHELCGDDAVGVRIAGLLRARLASEHVLAIEAGPAPENFTSVLRRFQPDLVLLIDAALMGEQPGTVRWLDPANAQGFSASTHTLPLDILVSYLASELGCSTAILGVQPEQTFADAPLTPRVQAAAEQVAAGLMDRLTPAAQAAADMQS
jgi:hydrogenase maturation protease HycI